MARSFVHPALVRKADDAPPAVLAVSAAVLAIPRTASVRARTAGPLL
jgi:hypothetical protein